jgi:hypothetical protein
MATIMEEIHFGKWKSVSRVPVFKPSAWLVTMPVSGRRNGAYGNIFVPWDLSTRTQDRGIGIETINTCRDIDGVKDRIKGLPIGI